MRRTQEERSETTRRKLVEATARCLARDGYSGTSTTRIAKEAGVSRGAQLHHYPTKADLVRATILHVYKQRVAHFRDTVTAGADTADVIDRLWEAASDAEVFVPWLELTVAGRADPVIADALAQVTHQMRDETTALAADLGLGTPATVAFAFALFDGLALQQLAAPDEPRREAVLTTLKTISRLLEASP